MSKNKNSIERSFSASLSLADSDEKRARINGYSGDEVMFYGSREVIDLAGMQAKEVIPVLMEHDRRSRVGFAEPMFVEKDEQRTSLAFEDVKLLDTAAADDFYTTSKKGFPWEASIGATVGDPQEVKAGDKVRVNGRDFTGPITVWGKSKLREISVCVLGADSNTSSVALTETAQSGEKKEKRMATIAELRAAFPGEAEFVLSCVEKELGLVEAKAEYADILATRLAEARGALDAANEETRKLKAASAAAAAGTSPVAFVPAEDERPLDLDDEVAFKAHIDREWAKPETRQEHISKESFAAYVRAEREGTVQILGVHSKISK